MATYKYGSWVGAQQTGKITQRAYLGYSVATNNNTTYALSAFMGVDAWNTNWDDVTVNWTFAGTGYTTLSGQKVCNTSSGGNIRCYPADGVKTFSYTKGHSAVTKTITATTTLNSVDSSAGGASVNGKKSTATYSFTVPAKTHYTVTFKPNGGTGGPTTQTKWYNEALTLTNTIPTRTNYTFSGWNTKADGSGTNYAKGGTVAAGTNSALTLYAKWTRIYVPAVIKINASYRTSTEADTTIDRNPEGQWLYVNINYSCGYYKDSPSNYLNSSLSIKVVNDNDEQISIIKVGTTYVDSITVSGVNQTWSNSSGRFYFPYDKTKSYKLTVTLSNSNGFSVTAVGSVPSAKYPFELASNGEELALGVSTKFKDDTIIEIDELNAATKPIDKSLYDALVNIGWDGILT